MPIVDLRLTNLGALDNVKFEFDEHINVLVGPNNCGKSTALLALGNVVAYPLALPGKLLRQAPAEFAMRFVGRNGATKELRGVLPLTPASVTDLEAWGSMLSELGYSAFVPALRQSTGFRALGPMTSAPGAGTLEYTEQTTGLRGSHGEPQELPHELRRRQTLLPTNAMLLRDEVAIENLVDLHTRAYRWNDPAMHRIIALVATMTSDITDGFPMQFLRVAEDQQGFFPQFRTPDGDIPFNVLSQGTQSVMQWLTYLLAGYAKYYGYATNFAEQPGVVLIDEIDAHLHPASQRRILPALQRHFPRLQLLCSTHSPLMLAGLQTSQVQLFTRDSHGKVQVSRNETDIVGWSADEILRGFLGVAHPTDLETARRLARLQELRRLETPSPTEIAELEQLQHTVRPLLLGELYNSPLVPPAPQVEPAPSVAAPSPKARAPKPPQKKRASNKTAAAATPRRTSRSR
jgi:energy-coupling factor transporter ATP-binding protein EcfA2